MRPHPTPAAAAPPLPPRRAEHALAQRDRRHDGQDRRDRRPLRADAGGEVPALVAQLEVVAQMAPAEPGAGRDGELLADRVARGRAGVGGGHQVPSRLEHERLDLVRSARRSPSPTSAWVELAELGQQERRALIVGQRAQIGEQCRAGPRAARPRRRGSRSTGRRRRAARRPRGARAAATRSGCGRPCRATRAPPRDLAGAERAIGRDERVLHDVLGVVDAAHHVAGEREQLAVVALIERSNARASPPPRRSRELLVGGTPVHTT